MLCKMDPTSGPRAAQDVCSPQYQTIKTCLFVNILWILFSLMDYTSLKLVILIKMDVFKKARWQEGSSLKDPHPSRLTHKETHP